MSKEAFLDLSFKVEAAFHDRIHGSSSSCHIEIRTKSIIIVVTLWVVGKRSEVSLDLRGVDIPSDLNMVRVWKVDVALFGTPLDGVIEFTDAGATASILI